MPESEVPMKLSINRLEDILLAQGEITKEQHAMVRKYIMENKISSTVAITDLKIKDINGIYRVVADALGVEFVPIIDRYSRLSDEIIALIPENTCKAFCVLPWELNGNELKLLIDNPQNTTAIREVQDLTGKKVKVFKPQIHASGTQASPPAINKCNEAP